MFEAFNVVFCFLDEVPREYLWCRLRTFGNIRYLNPCVSVITGIYDGFCNHVSLSIQLIRVHPNAWLGWHWHQPASELVVDFKNPLELITLNYLLIYEAWTMGILSSLERWRSSILQENQDVLAFCLPISSHLKGPCVVLCHVKLLQSGNFWWGSNNRSYLILLFEQDCLWHFNVQSLSEIRQDCVQIMVTIFQLNPNTTFSLCLNCSCNIKSMVLEDLVQIRDSSIETTRY